MIKGKLTLLSAILMFLLGNCAYAQYGHYWTENYGTKSMLLSGTVNASVNDLGAVFYNPGRLGQIENPAFVISAKVYQWNTIKIKDGIDEGVDLKKSSFGNAPSLVAGTFKLPFLKNHKFAYSFLSRQRTQMDFFVRVEEKGEIIDAIPGNVTFNGKLNFASNSKDEWMGLTWAPPIGKKFSLGLSNFVSSVEKSSNISLNMNTLDESNQVASFQVNRQYSYKTYGLIWKLGAAWDLKPVHLGMTITSPRVSIQGKGSTLSENFLTGIDTSGNGINDDVFIYDYQDNLATNYRYPWAIGLGAGFQFKKVIIHLSAEWYDKVAKYKIIEASPFIGQSTGETISFTLLDELDPVLNYGIGLEWSISEKITIYGSFATDHSGVTPNITRFAELKDVAFNSVFRTDFYRFGSGLNLTTNWAEIALGATYTGASQEFDRPINFPDEDGDPVFESGNKSTLVLGSWRFILGFSFPFAEKVKEDMEVDPYF